MSPSRQLPHSRNSTGRLYCCGGRNPSELQRPTSSAIGYRFNARKFQTLEFRRAHQCASTEARCRLSVLQIPWPQTSSATFGEPPENPVCRLTTAPLAPKKCLASWSLKVSWHLSRWLPKLESSGPIIGHSSVPRTSSSWPRQRKVPSCIEN